MRWFKHMTATRSDEKIARLIAEQGAAGYGRWWMVLEVIAQQMQAGSTKCSVTYPIEKWRTLLDAPAKTPLMLVRTWLEDFGRFGLASVKDQADMVTVGVPNLLKYRDEYASRIGTKSRQTPDSVPTKKQIQKTDLDENSSRYDAERARVVTKGQHKKTQAVEVSSFCKALEGVGCDPVELEKISPYGRKVIKRAAVIWAERGGIAEARELEEILGNALGGHKQQGVRYPAVLLRLLSDVRRVIACQAEAPPSAQWEDQPEGRQEQVLVPPPVSVADLSPPYRLPPPPIAPAVEVIPPPPLPSDREPPHEEPDVHTESAEAATFHTEGPTGTAEPRGQEPDLELGMDINDWLEKTWHENPHTRNTRWRKSPYPNGIREREAEFGKVPFRLFWLKLLKTHSSPSVAEFIGLVRAHASSGRLLGESIAERDLRMLREWVDK